MNLKCFGSRNYFGRRGSLNTRIVRSVSLSLPLSLALALSLSPSLSLSLSHIPFVSMSAAKFSSGIISDGSSETLAGPWFLTRLLLNATPPPPPACFGASSVDILEVKRLEK